MINRFHVSSFKSFNDGFTFTADRPSEDCNAISTIVGKNNAGKSNFTEAFDFLRNLVLRRKNLSDIEKIRNLDHPTWEPISFKIDFTTYHEDSEYRFEYSLVVDSTKSSILSESLREHTPECEIQIIETKGTTRLFKSIDSNDIIRVSRHDRSVFGDLFSEHPDFDLTNTNYFYSHFKNSKMFDVTVLHVNIFMNWFINLRVITPRNVILASGPMLHENELLDCFDLSDELRFVDSDPSIHEKVRAFHQNIPLEEHSYLINGSKGRVGSMVDIRGILYVFDFNRGVLSVKRLEILKKGTWTPVTKSDLPEGIQRIIALFPILTEEFPDVTFIIDELDRKIHTNLTLKLIEMFQQRSMRQQLIFTTHETEILNSELVDPGNLWIIDKEEGEGSYLYKCDGCELDRGLGDLYLEDKLI